MSEETLEERGICIVAGEASGDVQGSLIVSALKKQIKIRFFANSNIPPNFFWGIAGPDLRHEGVEAIASTESIAVMGVSEILKDYLQISHTYKKIIHQIEIRKPLCVILIDYPGFNLKLAQDVYALNIPVIYHIPPKVWSHGLKRIEALKKYTQLITSILPFEESFFRKHGINVKFVGNPLYNAIKEYKKKHSIQKNHHDKVLRIGLLPGSRKSEIKKILPILVKSFLLLKKKLPHIKGYLPVANVLSLDFVHEIYNKSIQNKEDLETLNNHITISQGNAYEVMNTVHYAWVCSGTAVLETCFFKTPLSALYKLSSFTFFIFKLFVKVKYATLPNLCANKLILPEFLQEKASPENLVQHAEEILKSTEKRAAMIKNLEDVNKLFEQNNENTAAEYMLKIIESYHLKKIHKRF